MFLIKTQQKHCVFLHLRDRPLKGVRGHNLADARRLHTSQLICDFPQIHGTCRIKASTKLRGPKPAISRDKAKFIEDIRCALYASKIVSYAQGFMLMRAAAKEYGWKLNYGNIALMWRGGCIIRSAFLGKIKDAYDKHPRLQNLLLDTFFKRAIRHSQKGWRNVVAVAAKRGIPVPAISTALAFFDSYRTEQLPANLLQAQRDYFGAHTYERIDKPRGEFFHTNWTGRGGDVSSSTYNA